jgi:ferredoxin--NADP+ reductase
VTARPRESYNATLAGLRRIHDDLVVMRVRPDSPIPAYEAGQGITLGVGMWEPRVPGLPPEELAQSETESIVRRPFSISSPILCDTEPRLLRPEEEDFYELYVTLPRDRLVPSVMVARLFALEQGARLWVDARPRGDNTLQGVQPTDDVLFAATGTGEAPHNRMLWELLRRGHRGRLASIVTTRRRADQAYREVHERVMQLFPGYRYTAIATREPGERGAHLQEMLRNGALEERAGFALDPARAHVFLCGNPDMIGAPRIAGEDVLYPSALGMVEILERQRGFHSNPRRGRVNVHFERY